MKVFCLLSLFIFYLILPLFKFQPIIKLIWYSVWPDHSYGRRDWLDYVLFPPRNDIIEHLKEIRSRAQLQQAQSVQLVYHLG